MFLQPAILHAGAATELKPMVDQAFTAVMKEYDVPGLVVGVTAGGERHFFEYGVASRESGVPATRQTVFEIGSLSKTFTATLAGYAIHKGQLSLHDHPGRHVAAVRGTPVDRAQMLHLGTYTAGGLPLQFPAEYDREGRALDYFRSWTPTALPGKQRRYSNPSLGLFGYATAAALGQPFKEAMHHLFSVGFGLRSTFIDVPSSHAQAYAWGYNLKNQAVRVNPGAFDAQAYGVKTSAEDLLTFIEAQLLPSGLDAPWRDAVRMTHVAHFEASPLRQCLGWEQYAPPATLDSLLAGHADSMVLGSQPVKALAAGSGEAGMLFHKTGSTGGFGAYAVFVPTRNVGIVMVANRNFPNTARIRAAHAVLATLGGLGPAR